jgi:geranylgeranyl diphosphate synthase type II
MKILTSKLVEAVEAQIESLALKEREPSNLYLPMDYILSLGGKRIRPVLLMLAYHAVSGKNPQKVVQLATAVELFHNFTLLHDDIMDRAPVRRGKPAAHHVWDEDTVILAGDALFALTMRLVTAEFPGKAALLIPVYSDIALEVCEGQMEDMDLANRPEAGIPEYIEMIRKKTAALLGGSLQLGAIAGGAHDKSANKFRRFGEYLGIAFQLQDDLMDAFPPEGFGKQIGGDIIENKKTFLLLKAYELADRDQRIRLDRMLVMDDDPARKVEGILRLYQELDIPEKTRELIHLYFEKARKQSNKLAKLTTFSPVSAFLETIIDRKL